MVTNKELEDHYGKDIFDAEKLNRYNYLTRKDSSIKYQKENVRNIPVSIETRDLIRKLKKYKTYEQFIIRLIKLL